MISIEQCMAAVNVAISLMSNERYEEQTVTIYANNEVITMETVIGCLHEIANELSGISECSLSRVKLATAISLSRYLMEKDIELYECISVVLTDGTVMGIRAIIECLDYTANEYLGE